MIGSLVEFVLGIALAFIGSAVRGGLALAGAIGLGLAALGFCTPLPTAGFGCALFVGAALLFVLAGGMRGQ